MMTHKQRMLMAVQGEMPDHIPYAPRIDLWYNANSLKGTLPQRHQGKTSDQIALSEGWALHKVVADHLRQPNPDAMLHRALGVHFMKEYVAHFTFTDRVKIDVQRESERTRIRYTSAKGSITTSTIYSQEMRRSGTSVPWIEEHAVTTPDASRIPAGKRAQGELVRLDLRTNAARYIAAHAVRAADGRIWVQIGHRTDLAIGDIEISYAWLDERGQTHQGRRMYKGPLGGGQQDRMRLDLTLPAVPDLSTRVRVQAASAVAAE